MGIIALQNDFSHGELDRRLLSRVDTDIYYKTGRKLRNVYVIPQGGVTKRHGTIFADSISANSGEYKLIEFELDLETSYLLVFIDSQIRIYRQTAPGIVTFLVSIVSVWSGEQVKKIKIAQRHNIMIITHPDVQTQQLTNGGDDVTWNLANFTFSLLPSFDFRETNYDAITFSLDNISPGTRTLTASAPVFTAEMVGGTFTSLGEGSLAPIGLARITGFTNTQSVTVQIIYAFDGVVKTPGVLGTEIFLGEPAFSVTRGWPKTVTFYQARLWFGGTRDLPQALFGSVINDFNSFDIGRGFDDDGISYELSTDRFGSITNIVSNKSFQIFTSDGEFAVPQLDAQSLTPGTVAVDKHSNKGSKDIQPVLFDNQTYYVQRGGRNIMRFFYTDSSASYESEPASLTSSQVIKNPIDSAVLNFPTKTDAEFMFFINEDGTLAVFQGLIRQNISGWTLSATGQDIDVETLDQDSFTPELGKFKAITSVRDDIFVMVERVIDGQTFQYLELLSFDVFTDSTILRSFGTPISVIPGLESLEGVEVSIVGDGFVLQKEVVENGQITLSRPSKEIQIGILFHPLIVPIPLSVQSDRGQTIYIPKRINRVWVDHFESGPFYFSKSQDQNLISFDHDFGPNVLDQPPTLRTGITDVIRISNTAWTARPEVVITQFDPVALTILAFGYEVST